jgi:restriction endonuclease S subunit
MVYRAKNKNEITTKYIYYYLSANIDILEKGFIGANHKNISHEYLENIKIPIPSLEKQKEIVSYLDFIYEKCNKTSNDKIEELKKLNEFCLNNQRMFGENEMKILEDICEINYGTRIVKSNNTEGEYPVFGSGRETFTTDTFNRDDFNILIGRFALSLKCTRLVNQKLFLNDSGLSIKPKEKINILLHKYIAYYFHENQTIIFNCARGTAQKNLDMDKFKKLKIPVPSLEKQKEIIEYCESNNNLIKQLENEIEQNKIQANLFLSNIVKKVKIEQDELSDDDSVSVKSDEE